MDRVSSFTLATLVAAAAATLAACGSSNSTGPNNAAPPDSVQQQIAQSIATSIQAEVASFTQFGAFSFFTPFTASPDLALRQGVTKLRETSDVDLVLLDVMMPEMDGYETARAIRGMSRFDALPIISLTAKAMKGDRDKCIAAGASDYITKPVDVDQLLSLMRVWLHR